LGRKKGDQKRVDCKKKLVGGTKKISVPNGGQVACYGKKKDGRERETEAGGGQEGD